MKGTVGEMLSLCLGFPNGSPHSSLSSKCRCRLVILHRPPTHPGKEPENRREMSFGQATMFTDELVESLYSLIIRICI